MSSQYTATTTSMSSQCTVTITSKSSQYTVTITSTSSQCTVTITSKSSQFTVTITSTSSQYTLTITSTNGQHAVTMTSTNSQDPSYDLCKDSLSFVSVPLVAPVVLQPHLGRYLLPALVRYCTRQMQWHIHVDNAQSDSSVVMLNSTHATTVRSLASKYMHNRIT